MGSGGSLSFKLKSLVSLLTTVDWNNTCGDVTLLGVTHLLTYSTLVESQLESLRLNLVTLPLVVSGDSSSLSDSVRV